MNSIPVDTNRLGPLLALGVSADIDPQGAQKADRDGQPAWKVEVLHRPPQTGDFRPRPAVEVVKLHGREPVVKEMEPVQFTGLVARAWEMNGRSGVALSADGIAGSAPKGGESK